MSHDTAEKGVVVATKVTELAVRPIIDPYTMMQAMIEKGVTAENAEAFKIMCQTVREIASDNARREFFSAMAALQAELPNVMATKSIPGKDGMIRSTFAPRDEIMAVLKPCLVKYGFSVSFDGRVEPDGKRLTAICIVAHVGGHSETREFSVRVSAPPGCSDAQADGSTITYAQRYALCSAFNIVIDHDTDARIEGGTVSAEVAKELEEAVDATKSDKAAFLKFAEARSFADIREAKVGVLREALAKKAAKQGKRATDEPPREPSTGPMLL